MSSRWVSALSSTRSSAHPDFPMVRICASIPGSIVTKAQLEGMGLVAAPEPEIPAPAFEARTQHGKNAPHRSRSTKVWPDYARSLAGAPPNRQGNGPDRSMADFNWCMTAIDWRWSIEDTAARPPEVSERARERVRRGIRDTCTRPCRLPLSDGCVWQEYLAHFGGLIWPALSC